MFSKRVLLPLSNNIILVGMKEMIKKINNHSYKRKRGNQ